MGEPEMKTSFGQEKAVGRSFEVGFLSRSLERQIEFCAKDLEMNSLLYKHIISTRKSPVLEAGCGSGRWMHYLKKHNIIAVEIDWSEELQKISNQTDDSIQFDVVDMRKMPYSDNYFAETLALGSIEHIIEGPELIFKRTLQSNDAWRRRNNHCSIYSFIRKISLACRTPISSLKHSKVNYGSSGFRVGRPYGMWCKGQN